MKQGLIAVAVLWVCVGLVLLLPDAVWPVLEKVASAVVISLFVFVLFGGGRDRYK